MKIQINVTKDILERSKMCGLTGTPRNTGFNCAISLAIREIFPDAWVATCKIVPFLFKPLYNIKEVMSYEVDSVTEDIIALPKEASEFINEFDRYGSERRSRMQPISFEIDVPDSIIEKIGISEAIEIIKNSETLELVN